MVFEKMNRCVRRPSLFFPARRRQLTFSNQKKNLVYSAHRPVVFARSPIRQRATSSRSWQWRLRWDRVSSKDGASANIRLRNFGKECVCSDSATPLRRCLRELEVKCWVCWLLRTGTGTMTTWSTMILLVFPRTRYRGRSMVPRGLASYFFFSLFLASERNPLIPNSLLTLVRLRWMACPIGYFDAWIRQDSLQVSFQRQYSLDILSKNSYSRTLLNTEAPWWLFLHYLHLRPPLSSLLCMLHPQFLRRWRVSMISRSNLFLKSLIDDFEWYVKNASGA